LLFVLLETGETGRDSEWVSVCVWRVSTTRHLRETRNKEEQGLMNNLRPFQSPHGPQIKVQPHVGFVTPEKMLRWSPSLMLWGGAAAVAALLFTEGIPRVRRDILERLPAVGEYWDRPIDPHDSPF